ncbi:phage major capsid protein [Massilia sp. DJPM01]|uniref:phage major capsid protein n=1 Tax=Massilia sp. DJPM01 TaxID=3024404 RepID=UPI00259EC4E2|nr:phage major capsid protein [Massilia sp. DJPM01]MDM5176569.1 phage major capsid protein [Massilia sp. DJPM01]
MNTQYTNTTTPLLTKSYGDQHGGASDVAQAITELTKSANARIDATAAELKEFKEATNAQIMDLEQKGVRRPAGDDGAAVAVSSLVLKSNGLSMLRDSSVKNLRISVPGFELGQKATITSNRVHVNGKRETEIFGSMGRRIAVRDLLITRPTKAASIEYLKGNRTGTAAIQVVEGDEKSQIDLSTSLETAPVRTIAVWIPASRQALDDEVMLADYIDTELRDALQLAEDAQLLKGSGTGANIMGMWTVATGYIRHVTGDKPSDTLRRAITQVQLARGVATGIVINPIGLEMLELDKDGEGRYQFSYTVTDDNGRASVWRVPVVVTDAMGPTEFMVGDFSRAARLYDRQQATIEIATQHQDYFTRNLLAILAEERVALAVMRPEVLIKGVFTA